METVIQSTVKSKAVSQSLPVKENNKLVSVIMNSGLEETKGQLLLKMFTPYFSRMAEIEVKINGLNKTDPKAEDIKIAREIRLALKGNRIASEKVRKDAKAHIIIEGRLIDNLNGIIENTSKTLELQCEKIEKDAEIKESARIEAIRHNRAELLSPYIEDSSIFPLGTMTMEQFDTMLSGYKLAKQHKENEAARVEAERLEKEAAEKLEQEKIRLENIRLKAEAEAKEKAIEEERAERDRLAKIESDRQAAILKEQQEKAAAELAEATRLAKIESDKQAAILKVQQEKAAKEKAESDAKLKAAADEADRLQKEIEKKQAEEKAESDRIASELAQKIAEEEKAAKAPIKEKLKVAIESLSLQLPESKITVDILTKYGEFKSWALQHIETL